MKTNKTTRPIRQTRPAHLRPTTPLPQTPPTPRPGCEFLDFCLYPGMQTTEFALPRYPTAV